MHSANNPIKIEPGVVESCDYPLACLNRGSGRHPDFGSFYHPKERRHGCVLSDGHGMRLPSIAHMQSMLDGGWMPNPNAIYWKDKCGHIWKLICESDRQDNIQALHWQPNSYR